MINVINVVEKGIIRVIVMLLNMLMVNILIKFSLIKTNKSYVFYYSCSWQTQNKIIKKLINCYFRLLILFSNGT